jgi:hypothetical protein
MTNRESRAEALITAMDRCLQARLASHTFAAPSPDECATEVAASRAAFIEAFDRMAETTPTA